MVRLGEGEGGEGAEGEGADWLGVFKGEVGMRLVGGWVVVLFPLMNGMLHE